MTEMTPPPLVTAYCDSNVLTLTLGAPPAHCLSLAMIQALQEALDTAAADPECHVLLLSAPGHIFCAGHDLKEINRSRATPDHGKAFLTALFDACAQMMQTLAQFPKPTIAMVHGIATAAGLQMVASCDLAFAAPKARFCLPGVNNGGFCTTPAVAVSRAIGRKHLMELLLSGEPQTAQWALNAGLINRVIAADELQAHTFAFAAQVAGRHQTPIRSGKAALDAHDGLPLDAAYAQATPVMIDHILDPTRVDMENNSKFRG